METCEGHFLLKKVFVERSVKTIRPKTKHILKKSRSMSSSLSKILETEVNVFKSNSRIIKDKKYYEI